MSLKSIAVLALTTGFASIASAQNSGTGKTTRYWDCCKPSCSWTGKAAFSSAVAQCDINGNRLRSGDDSQRNGCESGGSAFMCNDQTPWEVNESLAYGFAAVKLAGQGEWASCCACYELTFTSGPVVGKKMIVQSTNTGGDLGDNHFDIAFPGGGLGIFDGCSKTLPNAEKGARYGGLSDASGCPSWGPLAGGCNFRFRWFQNADNPSVDWKRVQCPVELTAKTGCKRNDDAWAPVAQVPAAFAATVASSTSSAAFTFAPIPTTTAAPVPTGNAACGQRGYDLQNPPTSFFDGSGALATFDACKSRCTQESAQSFAFGNGQCLCYPAPVTGNLNSVADSPITFYDIGCTEEAPPVTSETETETETATLPTETATASVPAETETGSATIPTETATGTTAEPVPTTTDATAEPSTTGYATTTATDDESAQPTDACPVQYVTVYDE